MGADAILVPMVDRPHVEIDGFAAAKGAFDVRQGFVGKDRRLGIEFILGHRGAQHIDPVEFGFGRDPASLRAKVTSSSVMVRMKSLAILLRLSTAPTASPMAAAPRSGRRLRWTRVWMACKACSVVASSSLRLRPRSAASAGLRQTIRRSPG